MPNYRDGIAYTDGAMHVTLASGSTIPSPTISSPTFTGTVTISATSAGFADGTAAAPSIPFASDADGSGSGLYRSASNAIATALNGTAVMNSTTAGHRLGSTYSLGWSSNADPTAAGNDTTVVRAAANSLVYGPTAGGAGAATTRTEGNKAATGIANNSATTVATITIPNAAHSASILLQETGSLGAGGAIGANEASATNCYIITLTRTAGVATTAAISSAFGAAATAVAGAATVTSTATLAAVAGLNSATQTIDIQLTIVRSGGSSTNHTAVLTWTLLNANGSGITIA